MVTFTNYTSVCSRFTTSLVVCFLEAQRGFWHIFHSEQTEMVGQATSTLIWINLKTTFWHCSVD